MQRFVKRFVMQRFLCKDLLCKDLCNDFAKILAEMTKYVQIFVQRFVELHECIRILEKHLTVDQIPQNS